MPVGEKHALDKKFILKSKQRHVMIIIGNTWDVNSISRNILSCVEKMNCIIIKFIVIVKKVK